MLQASVFDMDSMEKVIRHNDFKHDKCSGWSMCFADVSSICFADVSSLCFVDVSGDLNHADKRDLNDADTCVKQC
jgi:hypothetical protein